MTATLRALSSRPDSDPQAQVRILKEAKAQIRNLLQGLKPDAKETINSRRLLDALDFEVSVPDFTVRQRKAREIVDKRLSFYREKRTQLKANERRDLLIIIMFGTECRLPQQQRWDACSFLNLYGDDAGRAQVCTVFPGLGRAFQN